MDGAPLDSNVPFGWDRQVTGIGNLFTIVNIARGVRKYFGDRCEKT